MITMNKKLDNKQLFINYELLDLFDEQFNIDSFEYNIKTRFNESDQIINTIYESATGNKKDEDVKLVVNMSDELKEAYKNGDIKLDTDKNGEMYAQLKNKGKYGKKLSVREETGELDAADISFAMELNAIKEQLSKIVETLKDIETYVVEVVEGLHNDRVGLFYSGLSTYIEASQVTEKSLRYFLASQAIQSINDSQAQVIQEFKNDVKYLINHEFNDSKNKKRQTIIKEKMDNIHRCFETIYRATLLKAIIYFDLKQLPAMLLSLEQYGRFIEKLVEPNVSKLIEFDKEDKLINTIWEKRADSFKECAEIKNILSSTKTYYITTEEQNG